MSCITFDFDSTLALSHLTDDGDWEHVGPNEPIVAEMRRRLGAGERVLIVTSRVEAHEERPDRLAIQRFLHTHGLAPERVVFTNGRPKAETLVSLGSTLHFDDDEDEAKGLPAGIEFRLVAPSE